MPEKTGYVIPMLLMTAALVLALLYFYIYPFYGAYFPKCLFYTFTGWYCPGCGSQRSLVALLHGDITAALRENLLAMLAFPFLIYSFVKGGLRMIGMYNGHPRIFHSPLFVKVVFLIVVLFGIIRNIPVYPFTLLAPL